MMLGSWEGERMGRWEVWNSEVGMRKGEGEKSGMRKGECGMRKQPHGAKSIAPGVGSLEGEKMRGWEDEKLGSSQSTKSTQSN
jgi:hypothetical protein